MTWNRKQLRKGAWNTVFRRGLLAWMALVAVCFIFSYLGVDNTSQTKFVKGIDQVLGQETEHEADNVTIIKEYVKNMPIVNDIPGVSSEEVARVIDSVTVKQTWIIKLLGANTAYVKRNPGEVIVMLIISALIMAIIHFFIQSAAIVGKCRYAMECRYSNKVSVNRIFAPFHRHYVLRLMWDMFCYNVVMTLWWLTLVGGVYKYYQYRMVPYLLAENPRLKWRDARNMSKEMTRGYKWKMFLTDVSCIHVWIIKAIPVAGLLVALPFEMEIEAEMYFWLRQNIGSENFVEKAFDGVPYYNRRNTADLAGSAGVMAAVGEVVAGEGSVAPTGQAWKEPVYILQDVAVEVPEGMKVKSEYSLRDFIFFFFVFCFIGWLWEVVLYIVMDHVLVNRGTMYGPWLPVYGVGGVAIIFLLDRFKANKTKLFFMAMVVCGIIEFAASWALDFFFNSQYWDYTNEFLNVNGRICLVGLLAFGMGSLFGVYIAAPKLSEFLNSKSKKVQNIICITLSVLFIIDLICCAIFGFNKGSGVGGNFS